MRSIISIGILLAWGLCSHAARGAAAGDARDWWSLVPLVRPGTPRVTQVDSAWARSPIDAFVVAKMREHGLAPSPEADRRTLIRRVYYDLLGLPPRIKEVDAFLADQSPNAYERLIDRLLDSPRYGERWARHWLDVIHFGDTHGYDKDKPRPHAWPYRDYVIRAFNVDKPYALFVQEQLAGDILFPHTLDGMVATGFISAGPWDFVGHVELPESKIDGKIARHLDRDDMVMTTMTTFLSLTAQCAQCHDHKFDAVTQVDYYRLQANFAALDRADRPFDPDLKLARFRRKLTERKSILRDQLDTLQALIKQEESDEREPGGARAEELVNVQEKLEVLQRRIDALPAQEIAYVGTVHGWDRASRDFVGTSGQPREIRVLLRGDIRRPGQLVQPGTVDIISGVAPRFDLGEDHTEGERRIALANWIVRRDNPLTWRSVANRVWQYHFGRGIVDSPNDFGRMGQLPTHPNLLNWLAVELRDGGQSLKTLHRSIVTSATYRQASTHASHYAKIDAGNRYLWRMNRRKLEAEAVRDSVLAVAEKLDRRMYGPGFQDFALEKPKHSPHYEYHKHDPEDPATHRRAIYRFLVRSQPQPFMNTLDCADPSQMVDKRNETLTALQALALLNNGFMLSMSQHFAAQLETLYSDRAQQVNYALRQTLGREPTPEELEATRAYAQEHGLANACRIVFNLNEFIFVD